jgi:hypothetical protein
MVSLLLWDALKRVISQRALSRDSTNVAAFSSSSMPDPTVRHRDRP